MKIDYQDYGAVASVVITSTEGGRSEDRTEEEAPETGLPSSEQSDWRGVR